jgi:peptide/nickel transport system substrate-binding protein
VISTSRMFGVQANPTKWGAGWNMDRWRLEP